MRIEHPVTLHRTREHFLCFPGLKTSDSCHESGIMLLTPARASTGSFLSHDHAWKAGHRMGKEAGMTLQLQMP